MNWWRSDETSHEDANNTVIIKNKDGEKQRLKYPYVGSENYYLLDQKTINSKFLKFIVLGKICLRNATCSDPF